MELYNKLLVFNYKSGLLQVEFISINQAHENINLYYVSINIQAQKDKPVVTSVEGAAVDTPTVVSRTVVGASVVVASVVGASVDPSVVISSVV